MAIKKSILMDAEHLTNKLNINFSNQKTHPSTLYLLTLPDKQHETFITL